MNLAPLAAFVVYITLLLHPEPLFAHEARVGNIVLHARSPLPPESARVAQLALDRVARSPFYSPTDDYHVYLCDTSELFRFFSILHPSVGGVSQIYLTGNVFLRPSRIERDRLLGPAGGEVPGDRPLSYFIAHEVAHTMVARRIGRIAYSQLAVWQQEGYADYVGKPHFDFTTALEGLRTGAKELDPVRSGLYLRYHLFTAYALDHEGRTPEQLLSVYRPSAPIEEKLLNAPEHGQ